tara:strand:+ start:1585 stop:2166 length:582 start_codon:yes stop_codon:yes gene_type:complete
MSKRAVNLLKSYAIPYLLSEDQTFQGAVTHEGNVTNTAVTKQTNQAGSYANGLANACVKQVDFTGSSANVDSGAISIPGDAVITKLTCIASDPGSCGSGGNVSVQWGTTAGGTDFAAAVVFETGTTIAAGVGTSTDTALATALLGDNPIVQQPDTAAYISGAAEVHGRVIHAGGAWTAGQFTFIVEWVYLGGN